jgi:hypothetical protein
MDTAPLKSFATWSRTALIREVTARIAVVLAPASPQRVEQPQAVAALEAAIAIAGGGDKGPSAVADRVAYTWFNRIIALRFMDANGYTGIGVVSPQAGVEVGQPELLAEAKRANIDPEVVSGKTRETVAGLLNGTRRSDDPQGEAYALLLAEYCRYWNRSMPFMFERTGDFSELLIPGNLLADDSVLNRAVKILTESVCQDVEVIGWLYQFYISERKDEVFAGFKKNKKAGADEIPAATQLFTPHWIVRYLVENSLGRLWMRNRPNSSLVAQMKYLVTPVDEESDFLRIAGPEDLKVIDPACGSGHILTYAFDLLHAMYEEDGYAPLEIPALILSRNLFGVEIDRRAGSLAAFALTMKARARMRTFFQKLIQPNVLVLQSESFDSGELEILHTRGRDRNAEASFWNEFQHADTFGSLLRPGRDLTAKLADYLRELGHGGDLFAQDVLERARSVAGQSGYLAAEYQVVIANPPYMGHGNMGGQLSGWLKEKYPGSHYDLMTAFMTRALELSCPGGSVAMINLPSWMFLSSFNTFRTELLRQCRISSLLHLGRGVFGSDFGSVAFVLDNLAPTPQTKGTYRRLFDAHVEVRSNATIEQRFLDSARDLFVLDQGELELLPGKPIAYWLSPALRETFAKGTPLSELHSAMNGMTTGENAKFLRLWHEVSWDRLCLSATDADSAVQSGARWFPYNKGGAYRKWYGNAEYVINWYQDGRDVIDHGRAFTRGRKNYFHPMVSWGKVSSGLPSFRYYPPGFLFDVAGTAMFSTSQENLYGALAFCNSVVAEKLLAALSPTLNYESGQISKLPIIQDPMGRPEEIAERLVSIARADWNSSETSWGFERPRLFEHASESAILAETFAAVLATENHLTREARDLEEENDALLINLYGLSGETKADVDLSRVSLTANVEYRFGTGKSASEYAESAAEASAAELVSYAVGCMFGRYGLDEPGLILSAQGATLQDYLARVSAPTFMPDADNVIPIVDGDWFEDDIVTRFRQFLRVAFGEKHFEENLRFLTEALGVKDLRDYFLKSFYKDHVQRYKKRPIYWLFSSPKGSFNALIYMHRYTPSTVSMVLNEYLREFKAKLEATLGQQERLAAGGGTPRQQAAAQKEADRIRKMLLELDEYEHDVLYPLASQQIKIDLDDGVKVNYPKFGAALRKIPGLEAAE